MLFYLFNFKPSMTSDSAQKLLAGLITEISTLSKEENKKVINSPEENNKFINGSNFIINYLKKKRTDIIENSKVLKDLGVTSI